MYFIFFTITNLEFSSKGTWGVDAQSVNGFGFIGSFGNTGAEFTGAEFSGARTLEPD